MYPNNKRIGIIYFIIWAASVGAFWFGLGRNAMGYSLFVLYAVIPVTTLAVSIVLGIRGCSLGMGIITPPLLGISYMLVEYLTFSLANMINISFSRINMPQISLIAVGAVLSVVGLLVGTVIRAIKERK